MALPHSHPPSSLDRARTGLAILQSQGWDPDSCPGLGANGQGILDPVRAVEVVDREGIGLHTVQAGSTGVFSTRLTDRQSTQSSGIKKRSLELKTSGN